MTLWIMLSWFSELTVRPRLIEYTQGVSQKRRRTEEWGSLEEEWQVILAIPMVVPAKCGRFPQDWCASSVR